MRNHGRTDNVSRKPARAASKPTNGSERRRTGTKNEEMTILHLLKNKDPDVFGLLKRKYHAKLSSVAYSICKNNEDVEEVMQDVYLTAMDKIDKFQERSSLQTWLYRVTMNAALMKQRSRRKDRFNVPLENLATALEEEETFYSTFSQVRNPEEALMAKELGIKLNDWVRQLPLSYQSVIRYRGEGFSIKETSEMLNTTQAAVKSRMHRTRNSLRGQFGHYFLEN